MTPGEVFDRHRGLAHRIAMGYLRKLPKSIEAIEIKTVALGGLWDAALRYHDLPDEEFTAMAMVRIRGAIIDDLRTQDDFPRRARKSFGKLWQILYSDGFSTTETIRQFTVALNIEEDLDRHSQNLWLTRAVEALPRQQRIVMQETMGGKTQAEIARGIDVTPARVSQIMAEARMTLQERWQRKMER
jgi:RNA polymerase sigma factor (sigma-70 family)